MFALWQVPFLIYNLSLTYLCLDGPSRAYPQTTFLHPFCLEQPSPSSPAALESCCSHFRLQISSPMKKRLETRKHCARAGCSKMQTSPAAVTNPQTGPTAIHTSAQCNYSYFLLILSAGNGEQTFSLFKPHFLFCAACRCLYLIKYPATAYQRISLKSLAPLMHQRAKCKFSICRIVFITMISVICWHLRIHLCILCLRKALVKAVDFYPVAPSGLQGCKNRPVRLLAGCRKWRLNQALSIFALVVVVVVLV